MTPDRVPDATPGGEPDGPGAHPVDGSFRQRTVLAWQRTGLSIAGGSLIELRLTGGRGGRVTVVLILVGGLLGLVSALKSRGHRRPGVTRTGAVAALMSAAVTLLIVAQLIAVIGVQRVAAGKDEPAHAQRPSTSPPRRTMNADTTTRKNNRTNLAPRDTAVRAPK